MENSQLHVVDRQAAYTEVYGVGLIPFFPPFFFGSIILNLGLQIVLGRNLFTITSTILRAVTNRFLHSLNIFLRNFYNTVEIISRLSQF